MTLVFKRWFPLVCIVLLCGAVFWYWSGGVHTLGVSNTGGLPTRTVTIGGVPVVAEVASTEAEREQGLSGRTVLPQGRGMLFTFDADGIQDKAIWMKDMKFAIDVVWMDANGTVVTVSKNISPDTYTQTPPQVFYPTMSARYVLELPAGFVAGADIAVGDVAQL